MGDVTTKSEKAGEMCYLNGQRMRTIWKRKGKKKCQEMSSSTLKEFPVTDSAPSNFTVDN